MSACQCDKKRSRLTRPTSPGEISLSSHTNIDISTSSIFSAVDTLVIVQGHKQNTALEEAIRDLGIETHLIGDCLSPRSAEEAVYEGLIAAREV
jgi:hypothetical protein